MIIFDISFKEYITDSHACYQIEQRKFNYIIDSITEKKILNKNGIIIIHRHKKDDDKFSDNLKILEEKKYGISKIFFGILN